MMNSFLKEFASNIHEQWAGNLNKIAIVVNNKRPVSVLQKHLAALSDKAFWSPQIFTIDEWVKSLDESQRLDEIEEFFMLYDLYNQILQDAGQERISQDAFFSFSTLIRQDFHQIMDYGVDAQQLFNYLEDVAAIEATFPTLTDDQKEALQSFWGAIASDGSINAQQKFLQLWKRMQILFKNYENYLKANDKTTLSFSYKKISENPDQYLSTLNAFEHIYFVGFNAMHTTLQHIIKSIDKEFGNISIINDWDAYYVNNPLNKAGWFFRKQFDNGSLNGEEKLPQNFIKDKSYHIYGMQGEVAQAKYLADLLPRLVADDKLEMEDLAVVLVDEELAIPVMQSIPSNIAYNLSMGYPLIYSNIYKYILWFMDIQYTYRDTRNLYLPTEKVMDGKELIVAIYPEKKELWNALLEKYTRNKNIPKDEFVALEIPFLNPIAKSKVFLEELYLFARKELESIDIEEEQENIELSLKIYLYQTLESFYRQVILLKREIEMPVLLHLLQQQMNAIKVPLSGYDHDVVQVLGLLESRALDFKKIVILGANEGKLPSLNQRPSLIPDNIRRAFALPVLEDQDGLVAHVFYSMIQRAEEVHLLYNKTITNNSTGELTRFMKQIEFEADVELIHYEQEQEVAFKSIAPLVIERTEEVKEKLKEKFTEETGFKFSASGLNSYMNCPLSYYLKYILGYADQTFIKEVLDASSVGSVIHESLEVLYKNYKGKEVTKETVQAFLDNIDEMIEQAIAEEHDSIISDDYEFLMLRHICKKNVEQFLDFDKRHSPFKILDLEETKKYATTLLINEEEQFSVNINVIVDRIDEYQGAIRLIDYKTGSIDSLVVKNMEDIFFKKERTSTDSAIFQVLLYAWVYRRVTQTKKILIPQIWSSRKMAKEPYVSPYININKIEIRPDMNKQDFDAIMEDFEVHLIQLLNEIIFSDKLIKHKEEDKKSYCKYGDFALFCYGSEVN